ncbi:hypothetical protein L810_1765 [Burkholderia sp. AU4i]|nr:hypothetical protein L810_1765 [Burkholderia sp. AU4i]
MVPARDVARCRVPATSHAEQPVRLRLPARHPASSHDRPGSCRSATDDSDAGPDAMELGTGRTPFLQHAAARLRGPCTTTASSTHVPRTDTPRRTGHLTDCRSLRVPAINRAWTRIAGPTTPSAPSGHGRKPPRPVPTAGRSRRVRSCSTSRCSNGSCVI